MSRHLAFTSAAAAFIAVLAIGVWAFGGGGDRIDPVTHGFCSLDTDLRSEAMTDPEGFDALMTTSAGRERLQAMLDQAPGAIADDVRTLVEGVRGHGHRAFADPSVYTAADRVDAWEGQFCTVSVTTTTSPFPFGNVPGVPFECPPGFVRVEGMDGLYHELLEHLRMTGDWVDTHEAEAFLLEQIPTIEGFEGMGGVICLPAEGTDVDVDGIVDHLDQYFPERIPDRSGG